jgi:hypothetical protein
MEKKFKRLNEIDKSFKRDKVILCGSGPSLDNINVGRLVNQDKYDTFMITDAVKLFDRPTFAINYHYDGIARIYQFIKNPKIMLFPVPIIQSKINKEKRLKHKINEEFMKSREKEIYTLDNAYFFNSKHLTTEKIENRKFDLEYKDNTIYHAKGSIVGALYFLIAFMGYKDIYYIGFDGGLNPGKYEYSQVAFHPRKPNKRKGAALDYAVSWKQALTLVKLYKDVKFSPLKECLKEYTKDGYVK